MQYMSGSQIIYYLKWNRMGSINLACVTSVSLWLLPLKRNKKSDKPFTVFPETIQKTRKFSELLWVPGL